MPEMFGSQTDTSARLIELEDTLRAIQAGEVDAVLVQGEEGHEVVPLGSAEASCHAFMESVDMGAAMFDDQGKLTYVNDGLARLLQATTDDVLKQGLLAFLPRTAAAVVQELLTDPCNAKRTGQITLGDTVTLRHVTVSSAPIPTAFGTGRALTLLDITDRIRFERSEDVARIGRAIMSSTLDPVLVCDDKGLIKEANPAMTALLGTSPVERKLDDVLIMNFPAETGIVTAQDLVEIVTGGGSIKEIAAELTTMDDTCFVALNSIPLHSGAGSISGCIISITDITKRRDLEHRQDLMMRENDHRMKNMLTMVSAISARTIATSENLAEFKEKFGQRLASLADVQTMLCDSTTETLGLQDLIQNEFKPYLSLGSARLELLNTDLEIQRDAAVSFALVLHELVTNAVKYGALSNADGVVRIEVQKTDKGVLVDWRETLGPAVAPPSRSGFGKSVIARGLGMYSVEPTEMEYHPEGLRCRMHLRQEVFA